MNSAPHARTAAGSLALAIAISASSLGAQSPAAAMRDSAGITIVQNGAVPSARVAFTLSERPTITLGALGSDLRAELSTLQIFTGMVRLSDGRWIVNDRTSVKAYDAQGKFLEEIGREGDGPGEYRQTNGICSTRGDSVLVFAQMRTVSVYDSALRFVRSFKLPDGLNMPVTRSCDANGSFIVVHYRRPNPDSRLPAQEAGRDDFLRDLSRVGLSGQAVAQLGTFPGDRGSDEMTRFGVATSGRNIYVGGGGKPEFRVHDAAGRLARIVRWTDDVEPMPERFRRSGGGGPGASSTPSGRANVAPTPETVLYFQDITADDEGRVWVRGDFRGSHGRRWTVFGPTGQMLGIVMMPDIHRGGPNGPVVDRIQRGQVVLQWTDANGAKRLSAYELTPVR